MNNAIPMPKNQQVHINLDAMENVTCGAEIKDQPFEQAAKCESIQFTKVFQFKRISALVSPTGQEQLVQIEVLRCLQCGAAKVLKK